MGNLIFCELMKLKRSKILLISFLGVMAAPAMMFIEAIQIHFENPEQIVTLAHFYDNSLIYTMLLMNFMVFVIIAAYLFSREYTERTLKMILPVPVSKNKMIASKFCVLFLWIMMLTTATWLGALILAGLYHAVYGMLEFTFTVAIQWFGKLLISGILLLFTISPFAFIAEKTKGLFVPMIIAAGVVMGSAALCNQKLGALYPWTATLFFIKGKIASTGYPIWLSVSIVVFVSIIGFATTFHYFQKEDIK